MEIRQPLHVMQALIELASQMPPAATSTKTAPITTTPITPPVEGKSNETTTKNQEKYSIHISLQPASFQIANYNVYPPPVLSTSTPLSQNLTVNVALVDCVSKTVISKGLQGGDVRVWRAGQNSMTINGLKLSKMNPIKAELHTKNSKHTATDFFLQFQIGESIIINSHAFKLVSSCSQLPNNIRENVRPFKKMLSSEAKSGSEEETIPVKKQKIEVTSSSESLVEGSPDKQQQSVPVIPITTTQDFNSLLMNNNTPFHALNKIQLPPVKHFIPNELMQKMKMELDSYIMGGDPENAARTASQLACMVRIHNYK